MLGINGTEMLILVVVALVVIGPKRLPEYAQKLRELVRQMRRMAEGAKDSVRRDFGDDFNDVDWQKLDPRQYDPRRIVREALVEEDSAIRESKLQGQSTTASDKPAQAIDAAAQGSADGVEDSGSADSRSRPQSPIERFQAQSVMRDRSATAPFDSEAT
ncbi:MAG: twin-arginine translocase TatA/TatE family subunit [Brevibacterium sp.]|uniref:twin-arginine translocase TatA/TatE family subunit n=1 Tax=Brevibacterium sp. TaxID=1701 RepID=UPI0026496236|nr:twin-arginine translocase TatA/TatE family subunit [Brevibacterium sp.]MDN5807418.1 twin-arginine translocase TatA/TatE family subunit [Brevibacterium sp.]MDN5834386.1 twin-arginine translocase TatA/TatE family subunit [Brevibacterium sp.]MDN5877243.1 twin-arginine translocase TatA/TatE family subunit [Brevibacterium sp.]MDN5909655.1 twin-arginine translocase TatA/TatE family subunit [Brevibacterium sp.]MDN6122926.1 twin-arginine translocase TatA/TatE family subunit [Brevibacterium sp.]